jgi:hypothetical protein
LENSLQHLTDLQNQYIDDNVKIRIRQKEFCAPQYLIDKIKQQINQLISQSAICLIQKIGKNILLTDEDNSQLNKIATRNNCRIETIHSKNEIQVFTIPKSLTETSIPSKLIIEQSNQFSSSFTVSKISLSNGSIQIHKTDYSILSTVN